MQSALKFSLALLLAAAIAFGQATQNFDNVPIKVLAVQGNVYMLAGAGGNVTLQVGKEGVVMVDTQFAPLAPRIMDEIRKLSKAPVRYIINTHVHPDHVGGNEAFDKLIPLDPAQPLKIIAHENVLKRMTTPSGKARGRVLHAVSRLPFQQRSDLHLSRAEGAYGRRQHRPFPRI
jgi:cyclase